MSKRNQVVSLLQKHAQGHHDQKSHGNRGGEKKYFHATGAKLEVGDVILPPSKRGAKTMWSPDWAFAGDRPEDVMRFVRNEPDGPHIYQVEPLGEIVSSMHGTNEFMQYGTKEGWRIVAEVPPPPGGWWKALAERSR